MIKHGMVPKRIVTWRIHCSPILCSRMECNESCRTMAHTGSYCSQCLYRRTVQSFQASSEYWMTRYQSLDKQLFNEKKENTWVSFFFISYTYKAWRTWPSKIYIVSSLSKKSSPVDYQEKRRGNDRNMDVLNSTNLKLHEATAFYSSTANTESIGNHRKSIHHSPFTIHHSPP